MSKFVGLLYDYLFVLDEIKKWENGGEYTEDGEFHNLFYSSYQENCRIYLDEYEVEEVDLRVNFDTSLLMKRFMVKE